MIQIFGTHKSAETRTALRFFAERRMRTHFVDLTQRAAAPAELTRFARQFGVQALIDRQGRQFAELGLRAAQLSDARWLETLVAHPLLLLMPLVRNQNRLTIGPAKEVWLGWVSLPT